MQIYNNPLANFIITLITIFTIFLFISSLMNIIGILQYRFTYKFWIGLGIIIFVASTLFGNTLTHLLLKTTDFYLFLVPIFGIYSISVISILIAIPSYIIAYFLFRKTTC